MPQSNSTEKLSMLIIGKLSSKSQSDAHQPFRQDHTFLDESGVHATPIYSRCHIASFVFVTVFSLPHWLSLCQQHWNVSGHGRIVLASNAVQMMPWQQNGRRLEGNPLTHTHHGESVGVHVIQSNFKTQVANRIRALCSLRNGPASKKHSKLSFKNNASFKNIYIYMQI